ncbi:hypothetical protein C8J57DRAFT_1212918 [Mycena rebaudengoi]|nr:hypothetical protein C8J57DRAFT_1212918 [Mycena rebaudengoi]
MQAHRDDTPAAQPTGAHRNKESAQTTRRAHPYFILSPRSPLTSLFTQAVRRAAPLAAEPFQCARARSIPVHRSTAGVDVRVSLGELECAGEGAYTERILRVEWRVRAPTRARARRTSRMRGRAIPRGENGGWRAHSVVKVRFGSVQGPFLPNPEPECQVQFSEPPKIFELEPEPWFRVRTQNRTGNFDTREISKIDINKNSQISVWVILHPGLHDLLESTSTGEEFRQICCPPLRKWQIATGNLKLLKSKQSGSGLNRNSEPNFDNTTRASLLTASEREGEEPCARGIEEPHEERARERAWKTSSGGHVLAERAGVLRRRSAAEGSGGGVRCEGGGVTALMGRKTGGEGGAAPIVFLMQTSLMKSAHAEHEDDVERLGSHVAEDLEADEFGGKGTRIESLN